MPYVAAPSTAGTGAEATIVSVLTNAITHVKKSIRHPSYLARGVVLDPELTVTCPREVTAHSGLDAFVQAVESYASIHASPLSRALSVKACRLIGGALVSACEDGSDRSARTDMAYGSYMAGVALANARLGLVHGLAHSLGLRCRMPHGLICGVLAPYALRFNLETDPTCYDGLSEALGDDVMGVTARFCRQLDIPKGLASYGLDRARFEGIVREGLNSGSMKANPRPVTREDILTLLEALISH